MFTIDLYEAAGCCKIYSLFWRWCVFFHMIPAAEKTTVEIRSGHNFLCIFSFLRELLTHVFSSLKENWNLKISCKLFCLHLVYEFGLFSNHMVFKCLPIAVFSLLTTFIDLILFKTPPSGNWHLKNMLSGPVIRWCSRIHSLSTYKITLWYHVALTCDRYPGSCIVITRLLLHMACHWDHH